MVFPYWYMQFATSISESFKQQYYRKENNGVDRATTIAAQPAYTGK
jgi:hypothetical protein